MQLNKLIPALKKITLQDCANLLPFYMYLNNELMNIEYLCCLAHARAKWNQIFTYRYDGEYSIDNIAAEWAIIPITVQRKKHLLFGSVKGIQNSAIYNTFIETYKQAGVSFRDYFCKLLRK